MNPIPSVLKFKPVLLFFMAGAFFAAAASPLFAQITSESSVDWRQNTFFSYIRLDMNKAGFSLPSGRSAAENRINQQLPLLVKNPLLSLRVDSSSCLDDAVLLQSLSLEKITDIIEAGQKTPSVYGRSTEELSINHSISLHDISALMIRHKSPYKPKTPIDQIASRIYTGIVIDARGLLPVRGEFIEARAEPCLFPKIWDETMELLYERNIADPEIVRKNGLVAYSSLSDKQTYQGRAGKDPLFITARQIFGTYRTDPVISQKDALKILSVPENLELLRTGRVVLLLNEEALVYKAAAPLKDAAYYFTYEKLENFYFENKIPDVDTSDSLKGMLISVRNLKFVPDSDRLLDSEIPRLNALAESLVKATLGNENTILVEGHTASIGKPAGEQNLSVDRAKRIISELVKRGVNKKLFTYRGYGGTVPIGDNDTDAGRALNRRVEITVVPKATYIQRLP